MASGILGTPADLVANTNTTLYSVPSDTFAVAAISICNRGSEPARVRIALSATATPTAAEWIEFDQAVSANGVLERTGVVIEAGKNIVVRSSATSVNAMVFGIETSTI
jgi:hypothetical protein